LFSRPSPPPNHLPRTLSDCTHPADALPYELRALEAVLAAAAKRLEDDAASLEGAAGPQFARLGAAVSRAELDRVRERKAALAALLARAAGVKQVCVAGVSGGWGTRRRVCRPAPPPTPHPSLPPSQALEGILGDDNAMDAMYLTRKADEEGGLEGGPAAAEAAAPAPAAAPDGARPPPLLPPWTAFAPCAPPACPPTSTAAAAGRRAAAARATATTATTCARSPGRAPPSTRATWWDAPTSSTPTSRASGAR